MKLYLVSLITFSTIVLASCAPADDATTSSSISPIPSGGLAGTEWKLVKFQSMDDALGTIRPEARRTFSVRFNADQTANMVLDCNRGNGKWRSDSVSVSGGSLTFGPVATTRAMCRPSVIGDRLTTQLQYIRSYTLHNGRLYLALMADGGIFEFKPVSAK